DIEYFKEIHLISTESLQKLKEDLSALIDKLEELATTGYHPNGSKVDIFISHTNLGTAYSYIDAVDQQLCFIKLQEMNVITSHNEILFENMKRWADSMKRFSILISQSADIYRYKFFRQQREYVNKL
ncbi:MAG: hypothetical protein LUG98_04210, partial [Tannerellaceae bacterium]|nr:hypothetical protein [Tannerellaceae bacterium]